jgi:hypothetical protein
MKHVMQAQYPAPAEVVLKMFSDPAFHTRKLEAMGLTKYQVLDSGDDGQRFRIKIERKVPIQLMGKSTGDSTVAHEERWDRKARTGEVHVETKGIPIAISAKATVRDQGPGCLIEYTWTIESNLPLVGGKLEKMVVADMDKRAEAERQAAIAQLDGYR